MFYWLTVTTDIKKYDRVISIMQMFIASFVKTGSAVETRAMACTKPAWWTQKHALSSCSKRELCLKEYMYKYF